MINLRLFPIDNEWRPFGLHNPATQVPSGSLCPGAWNAGRKGKSGFRTKDGESGSREIICHVVWDSILDRIPDSSMVIIPRLDPLAV